MSELAPVTVVIPYFDDAATIGRALRSVREQTSPPAEIVVVDDGSRAEQSGSLADVITDEMAVAAGTVRLIRLEANRGPAAARNAAWDAARQPYLAFLDADDSWLPEKLERQLAMFEAHPEATLVAHGGTVAGGDTGPALEVRAESGTTGTASGSVQRVTPFALLVRNRFSTPSVMMRTAAPFRFDETLRFAEDRDLWLRVLTSGAKVLASDDVLVVFHKDLYGAAGLSARLWQMERGELTVYLRLLRRGDLSPALFGVGATLSLLKYVRRLAVVAGRQLGRRRTADRNRDRIAQVAEQSRV